MQQQQQRCFEATHVMLLLRMLAPAFALSRAFRWFGPSGANHRLLCLLVKSFAQLSPLPSCCPDAPHDPFSWPPNSKDSCLVEEFGREPARELL